MRIRVLRGERGSHHQIFNNRIWLVIALLLLVLHHTALQVQNLLANRVVKVPHAVALRKQRIIQRRHRNIFKIVRAVFIRCAIQVGGANPLHRLDIAAGQMLTAAKHQMFKEVREPCLTGLLILRPNVVPNVQSHNRRLVVFVNNHSQSVIKDKLLTGNFKLGKVHLGGKTAQ